MAASEYLATGGRQGSITLENAGSEISRDIHQNTQGNQQADIDYGDLTFTASQYMSYQAGDFDAMIDAGTFGQVNGGNDPNALDPSTLNQNLFGMHYPGGNNPLTYARDPDYSTTPVNLAGYPAIGHDRRYDNLGVAGAKGLLTDTRAIGADWRFVSEEFQVGNLAWQFRDVSTAIKAYALGIGLGAAALPKTLFQYRGNTYTGHAEVMVWYYISNQGVTNKPSK